jgi:hypothetical protein
MFTSMLMAVPLVSSFFNIRVLKFKIIASSIPQIIVIVIRNYKIIKLKIQL